jgi:hypothetical protein
MPFEAAFRFVTNEPVLLIGEVVRGSSRARYSNELAKQVSNSYSKLSRNPLVNSRLSEERRVVSQSEVGLQPAFPEEAPSRRGASSLAKGSWLCIADIHLGTSRELAVKGITVPDQVEKFVAKISGLREKTGARGLILLGDVKHNVTGVNLAEMREIPEFLEQLTQKFDKIVIVKGNHDGNIEKVIPPHLDEKISVKKDFLLGDTLFTHGHRNLASRAAASNSIKTIVIGHNQPAVYFRDSLRARYIEPCWVRGPLGGNLKGKDLIIVPAFNDVRGNTLINRQELLGPIAAKLDTKSAHTYLLDGTDLGTIKSLEVKD